MKKSSPTFILSYCVFLIVVGITGCSEKSAEETRPPLKSPAYLEEATPEPVVVSEKTRETYQWYCAQCHGIQGKGDGINAKFLTVPPRNHTKAKYLETRTDKQFFEAIKFGGLSVGRAPCMPAWGNTMSDSTIHELVRYIRELCQCEAL
ncbi:MAG TPA: cytochrome c [Nitrospinae bacterium]|nr:cytochrome c [Nitrospinota bacterium]